MSIGFWIGAIFLGWFLIGVIVSFITFPIFHKKWREMEIYMINEVLEIPEDERTQEDKKDLKEAEASLRRLDQFTEFANDHTGVSYFVFSLIWPFFIYGLMAYAFVGLLDRYAEHKEAKNKTTD